MSKQITLKSHRNYLETPRRSTEFDEDHRGDVSEFDPSRTKQSDAEAADINFIMKRYEQTGQLPEMINREASYGDFSDMGSYQEALNIVQFAQSQFYALDAHIRARFGNDPAQFLAFTNDPKNLPEMVKMGLAVERPENPADILKGIRDNTKPHDNRGASNNKKGAGGRPPVSDDEEGQ